jgi:hypothetical protein
VIERADGFSCTNEHDERRFTMNMQHSRGRFGTPAILIGAALALTLSAGSALAQGEVPSKLFLPAVAPAGATPHRQAIGFMPALVDTGLLATSQAGSKIELNVDTTRSFTMTVSKVERRPDGSYSVFGTIDGAEGTSVIFAVQDDAVASDITAPTWGVHYRTKYAGNGVHLVCNIDDTKYAPCGGSRQDVPLLPGEEPEDWEPEAEELLNLPRFTGEERNGEDAGWSVTGACNAPEVVFDAMIIYTDVARAAAGGTSAIQAEIQLAIDRTNESYDNSPISARMRLVSRYEITYDEVGTYEDHLDRLTGTNGLGGAAPWTTARTNRDTNNADFATVFVNDGDYCGLAWCTSAANRGYSVVTWDCAAGNLSHPHEIGHNQGCGHDIANGGCGYSNYAYGWRFNGSDGNQYRTVMAYSPGTRIPYFSNPDRTYLGTATGTALADNERVIEERKGTCEAFETTRWDIWVDFGFAGFPFEIGTFTLPYNTIPEGVTNLDTYVSGASEYPNLYIKEGSTSYTGTISKVMTIIPCGGPVTIGN